MATLTLAPFGFRPVRLLTGAAPTFQANVYNIPKTYATAIGFGDPVIRATGGFITAYTAGTSHILGIFAGVLPYFDATLQQVVNRRGWPGAVSLSSGVNYCQVLVYDDPRQVFTAQLDTTNANNPVTVTQAGGNIDAVIGTPSSFGDSTSYLDASTWNVTTSTLPFRVLGPSQNFFLGFDPTVNQPDSQPTNNYVDVVMNTSEYQTSTGI